MDTLTEALARALLQAQKRAVDLDHLWTVAFAVDPDLARSRGVAFHRRASASIGCCVAHRGGDLVTRDHGDRKRRLTSTQYEPSLSGCGALHATHPLRARGGCP